MILRGICNTPFGHLGKISNLNCKMSKWRKSRHLLVQEKQNVGQERKPPQNRHISLILRCTCFHIFNKSEVRLLKASCSLCLPDWSPDGVLSAFAWTWSFVLVFWFYNNQWTCQSTNNLRILWRGNRSTVFSENLLWIPSGKINKVPASKLARENSGDQSGILFKNCCTTDTRGG